MRRLIVTVAVLLVFAGVSAAAGIPSSGSVWQPDGTGCTKAGAYSGPNAVISKNYTGFKVVWAESVVQRYSSGVPLYWAAYMRYTNITSHALTLRCPRQLEERFVRLGAHVRRQRRRRHRLRREHDVQQEPSLGGSGGAGRHLHLVGDLPQCAVARQCRRHHV